MRANCFRPDAMHLGTGVLPHGGTDDERIERGIAKIGNNFDVAGYRCVPLVTEDLAVRCSVDILLLTPDPVQVVHSDNGDLDEKVKTIFDALQNPKNREGTCFAEPQSDEEPFFCLLEDDKLITELHVTGDQLLRTGSDPQASDAVVVINVKINHRIGGSMGRWLD